MERKGRAGEGGRSSSGQYFVSATRCVRGNGPGESDVPLDGSAKLCVKLGLDRSFLPSGSSF